MDHPDGEWGTRDTLTLFGSSGIIVVLILVVKPCVDFIMGLL